MTTSPVKTLPRRVRHLHRRGGAQGAPAGLYADELGINETDANGIVLYAGIGDDGAGNSTSQVPVGGPGAFSPLKVAQAGTGALQQSLAAKAMQRIDIRDFCRGVAVNGDETVQFGNAIAEAAAAGGVLELGGLIIRTGSLTLPPGLIIRGGVRGGQQFVANYYNQPGQIRLAPGATLTLSNNVSLRDLTLLPDGLNFGATSDSDLQALVSSFAGTALTGTAVADVLLSGLMILGFAQASQIVGNGRVSVDDCMIDCTAGVHLTACADTNRVTRTHVWPFVTAPKSSTGSVLYRAGVAFDLGRETGESGGSDDWTVLESCLSYGHATGFRLNNASNIRMLACDADGVASAPGAVGFQIAGAALDNKMIGCTTFNHQTGVQVNSTATAGEGIALSIVGGLISATQTGIDWQAGHLTITGRPRISTGNICVSIEAGAGDLAADMGDCEGAIAIVVAPAYAGSAMIDLPPHGGWAGNVIQGLSGATLTSAQMSSIQIRGAAPIHGGVPNRMLSAIEVRAAAPNVTQVATAATANNGYWSLVPHTYTFNGSTFGYYALTGYNDAVTVGVDCFGVLRSGGTFITFLTGQLPIAATDTAASTANVPVGGYYQLAAGGPVLQNRGGSSPSLTLPALPIAASDSAAAALSPAVPVGGLYKTSAGAVIQRTT